MTDRPKLTLGTRASALALAQTELTRAALAEAWPELALAVQTFTTRGDQKLDLSLIRASDAGGKGLFTKELEDALLDGRIDVAVHSLKDLPGQNPPGLTISAVLERAPSGDLLLLKTGDNLDTLRKNMGVGTSSVRRARQIQWLRPDLRIVEVRGNVQTRLRKLGTLPELDALILAEAGLKRLGFDWTGGTLAFEGFKFRVQNLADRMFPAIGQGVVALQTRADDQATHDLLCVINCEMTALLVRAERELQRLLQGDCTLPVGVRTRLAPTGGVELHAILFPPDGGAPRQANARSVTPEAAAAAVCYSLTA